MTQEFKFLDNINFPSDLRKLSENELESPPFTDINLKAGDTLRTDWFPVVWSR